MKGNRINAAAVVLSTALSIQSVLTPIAAISPVLRQSEVSPDETVIYASDYGADPTGTFDSTEAIQKTFAAAKEAKEAGAKSVRVEFEKGTYEIWKDKCEKRLVHTSNTSSTSGYGEKTIGLLIEDMSDLVVEGNGAEFMMHGNIMALGVFRSKNIELRNFSWDFAVPTTSEMTVVGMGQDESGKNYTDFYIPKTMPHQISGNTIVWTSEKSMYTGETYWQESGTHYSWCINGHDPEGEFTRRYYSGEGYPFAGVQSIEHVEGSDDTLVRITYSGARPAMQKMGMTLELNSNGRRETTGALVWESENVTARGLQIHYMHGFGWLLQMSKNMYFYDCDMIPPEEGGHLTTGFADGIHASGHSGEVVIENCRFASLHDDPINIHGTFTRVEEKQDAHTLVLKNIHSQQGGYQQYFVGDKVQFFTRDTLESRDEEKQYTVSEIVSNPGENGNDLKTMVIRFEEELPDYLTETYSNQPRFVAENVSYCPDVTIRGCTFRDLAARAVLVTTRGHVLVENNTFYNMTMDGYNSSNDADNWYESGPVRDVTIRNNTFYVNETNGTHNHKVINIDPVTLGGGFPDYTNPIHKNITIEDNTFYMDADTVVGAWSVENLSIKNNKILRMYPDIRISAGEELTVAEGASVKVPVEATGHSRNAANENMYLFKACKNVQIEGNTYDDGQKLYAWYENMPEEEIHITNDKVTTTRSQSNPASAPVGAIHYTSSAPEIAYVDDEGTVHGKAAGTAEIKAWTEWNGSILESDPVIVTVTAGEESKAAPVIEQEDTIVLSGKDLSTTLSARSDLPVEWIITDLATGAQSDKASMDENGVLSVSGNALLKVTAQSAAGSDSVVVIADSGISEAINPAMEILNADDSSLSLEGTKATMVMKRGDIYTSNNSAKNVIMADLPEGVDPDHLRTVVHASGMPARESGQWDTLSFMLANDLDNYITIGRKSHYDGITGVREVGGRGSEMGGSSSDNALTDAWLGLTKDGDTVSLDFSADGENWTHVRDLDGAFLSGYRVGMVTWVTNERNKTAVFQDLKIGSADTSYAELVNTESIPFNGLANNAPSGFIELDQTSYQLGDTIQAGLTMVDADGDTTESVAYRWMLKTTSGTETIWTESPELTVTKTGTITAEAFVKDSAGLYASTGVSESAVLEAGDASGKLLSVSINGRDFGGTDTSREQTLLLPGSEKAVNLNVLGDGAEITVNGEVFDGEGLIPVEDGQDLVISTKSASMTFHVKKAASSKTALSSIVCEDENLNWTPADGALPVLVTDKPQISMNLLSEKGSLRLYDKAKGAGVLAQAAEGEALDYTMALSGGINTLMICNEADDGISREITKLHVVYMPDTSTEHSVLIDGQVPEQDGENHYSLRLERGKTSANIAVAAAAGQNVKIVKDGHVYETAAMDLSDLANGANDIQVIVTAVDGVTTETTDIRLVVPYDSDASLTSLTFNGESLDPSADTLQAMTSENSAVIAAKAQDPEALVVIRSASSAAVGKGSAELNGSFYEGASTVTVQVISPDGEVISEKNIEVEKAAWLSDLDWDSDSRTGYGSIQKDAEVDGIPLRLCGENDEAVLYAKGIGAHANCSINWTLPADTYKSLDGVVGVDYCKHGSNYANVTFTVSADGTEQFNSGVMYGNTPAKSFHLDLNGVSKVTLASTQSENSNWDAHSDFAGLKLAMVLPVKEESALDTTALEEALKKTENITPLGVSADALEAWKQAITDGSALLDKAWSAPEEVTQEELDTAAKAILDAWKNVSEKQEAANKLLLSMAVAQAELLESEGALEGVNELVVQAFHERLANAKEVLADKSATQAEVNAAWSALAEVIQMLDFRSDKSELADLLQQARSMDISHCSAENQALMAEAIAYGQQVLDDPKALNEQSIAEAVNKLKAAIEACKEVLDTSLLALLIENTESVDLSQYLESGQAEFAAALEQAKAVLAAPESQEQIVEATTTLHQAWMNLRLKPDESLVKALQNLTASLMTLRVNRMLSAALDEQIVTFNNTVSDAMENETLDNAGVKLLIKQGTDLLNSALNAPKKITDPEKKPEPEKPEKTDPVKTPAETEKNTPVQDKKETEQKTTAEKSTTNASVKTGVHTTGFVASALASLGLLAVLEKKRRNRK